jgi:hypothetical protein
MGTQAEDDALCDALFASLGGAGGFCADADVAAERALHTQEAGRTRRCLDATHRAGPPCQRCARSAARAHAPCAACG